MFPVWTGQFWLLTDVFAYRVRVVGGSLWPGQAAAAGRTLSSSAAAESHRAEVHWTFLHHQHTPSPPRSWLQTSPQHTKRPHFTLSATELDILGKHKYFWCPDTNIFAAPGVVCGSQPCGATGVQCCSKFFVWDINWILTFLPWYRYWGWGGRREVSTAQNNEPWVWESFSNIVAKFLQDLPVSFYINWE